MSLSSLYSRYYIIFLKVLLYNHREDAWRLYLGLSQKHNSFGISVYRPARSSQDKIYFKINNFLDPLRIFADNKGTLMITALLPTEDIERMRAEGDTIAHDQVHMIMGTYKLSPGIDENGHYISYYDKWDLDIPGGQIIGGPEIYDRIYYNPKTLEIIEPRSEFEEIK